MGGLGKTTLARYVFNDDVARGYFDVRVWVCVSNDYDMLRISKGILEAVGETTRDLNDLSDIQVKIQNLLRGKTFLIVFDDVWKMSYSDWTTLKAPLSCGARGSKIIVTTRLFSVADMMRTTEPVNLKRMEEDDCWRLFCVHASIDPDGNSALEDIGKEIARKCGGLPLAATILGGLLRRKSSEEDWKAVLNDQSWGNGELRDDELLSVLRISYYDLPPHLKKCFAFCAIFPEDHQFKENDLVLLWLGAGLISWDKSSTQREEEDEDKNNADEVAVGHSYFRDLVSRSMFLPSSSYNSKFVMHDAIRWIAIQVSGKSCFFWEETRRDQPPPATRQQADWHTTRHLSFGSHSLDRILSEMMNQNKPPPLRTFLPLDGSLRCDKLQLSGLFTHLKYLRVLSCRRSIDTTPLESISKLSHLRYLDLTDSNTSLQDVRNLLISITSLFKLEILILKRCSPHRELPEKIDNLPRMRYMNLSGTLIQTLPDSITRLTKLQTLILSECDRFQSLPEIGNLTSLRHLDLSSTGIQKLPDSITSLQNLAFLILRNCKKLSHLPPAMKNLINLRHLDISSTDMVKRGEFSSGISQLSNLCWLSDYVINRGNAQLLGNLRHLKGKLRISRLENLSSPEARSARLQDKKLDTLSLQWSPHSRPGLPDENDQRTQEGVLEELQPDKTLKTLNIRGYCGRRWPTWLRSVRLKELILEDCLLLDAVVEELPGDLESLTVSFCPLLENTLKRYTGIALVPRLHINGYSIQLVSKVTPNS